MAASGTTCSVRRAVSVSSAPSQARILVVDDDEVHLGLMVAILEETWDVTTARDGLQALELLAAGGIDVVCTDLQMPRMTGVELLARARARSSDVGFVLVTGMRDYLREVAAQPDGAQFHSVLVKPYEPEQLVEAVSRAASFAGMRRAVDAATAASGRLKKSP